METATLQPQILPDRPWQRVMADHFLWNGEDYLLTIDYFSRFIEVDRLRSTSSSTIATALSAHFSRLGIPEVLVSDNGPQFSSHTFAVFLARQGIDHRTSSPHHPQSNDMAERAVRMIKGMLSKARDLNEALLAYRSTPLQCGFSSAQLLTGRQIRSSLPSTPEQLEPAWPNLTLFRQQQAETKDLQAANFDIRHTAHPLRDLNIDDRVWIIDLAEGMVKERISDRSYIVFSSGSDLQRNVKSLRPLPKPEAETPDDPPMPRTAGQAAADEKPQLLPANELCRNQTCISLTSPRASLPAPDVQSSRVRDLTCTSSLSLFISLSIATSIYLSPFLSLS